MSSAREWCSGMCCIWARSIPRSINVLEDEGPTPCTYVLFPEHRCEGLLPHESIVRLKLKVMQLHRPRQWGACWLALSSWHTLDLDVFWAERLPPSRKGKRWDVVVFILAAIRVLCASFVSSGVHGIFSGETLAKPR